MKLTVVICTHNRADLLMHTITSLNEAPLPIDCSISLLVLANACSDETVSYLKNYQSVNDIKNLPLTFAEEPTPGKSYALNHALEIVENGYICFVDDDHRVDKKYFTSINSCIKQYPEASILCGQIIPDWTGEEPNWIHEQGKYKIYPLPIPHFELGSDPVLIKKDTKLPGGGNLVVKKEVFAKVGNFSTALGPIGHNLAGSEDSEFILRVLDAELSIQYVPDIIQYHYVDLERLTLKNLVIKSFQRSCSITLAHNPAPTAIPLYMWRKLFNYLFAALTSFNITKSRFYLMRIASSLGEMNGLKKTVLLK